jgi:hypothetical protein
MFHPSRQAASAPATAEQASEIASCPLLPTLLTGQIADNQLLSGPKEKQQKNLQNI